MARKATWLRHVDARVCLRGTEVTCHLHIYFITYGYRTYKLSIEDTANHIKSSTLYTRLFPFIFSVWDYFPCFVLITRRVACYGASDGSLD